MDFDITKQLPGIGIGIGTTFLIIIFVILNFDKVQLFCGFILRSLSFINYFNRKSYTLFIQGKINDICSIISPELFDKSLKIKWISKEQMEKIYSTTDTDGITVHIVDEKNPNKNIANIVQEFVSSSFIPNLRNALDNTYIKANEKFIVNKIIKKHKDSALSVYYDECLKSTESPIEKELMKKFYNLDRKAYYFPCYISTLSYVDSKNDENIHD
ncbi:MAG: hypothetical protein ACE14V_04315 [bacterium]